MIKNDKWIKRMALKRGMICPFESELIRKVDNRSVISYGLSSYGYDIRLSPLDFKIFQRIPGEIVDPKRFDNECLQQAKFHVYKNGSYFILPALSYGLGVSLEKIKMPKNVIAVCLGKSTYARCGIIANVTPLEPGWQGHITLEFSNSSSADCRIYADEGVVQLLFFEGRSPLVDYAARSGKYQNQSERVIVSRV